MTGSAERRLRANCGLMIAANSERIRSTRSFSQRASVKCTDVLVIDRLIDSYLNASVRDSPRVKRFA